MINSVNSLLDNNISIERIQQSKIFRKYIIVNYYLNDPSKTSYQFNKNTKISRILSKTKPTVNKLTHNILSHKQYSNKQSPCSRIRFRVSLFFLLISETPRKTH